jgi:rhodanese-related sulfurtransferase
MSIYIYGAILVFFVVWELVWHYLGVGLIFPWKLKKDFARMKKEMTFIDVRTLAEYRMFHIKDVIHLPEILAFPSAADKIDRRKPILVICMTGHRSPIAAYMLKKYGFKKVFHLSWGMLGWKLLGGPTTNSTKRDYHPDDQSRSGQ